MEQSRRTATMPQSVGRRLMSGISMLFHRTLKPLSRWQRMLQLHAQAEAAHRLPSLLQKLQQTTQTGKGGAHAGKEAQARPQQGLGQLQRRPHLLLKLPLLLEQPPAAQGSLQTATPSWRRW